MINSSINEVKQAGIVESLFSVNEAKAGELQPIAARLYMQRAGSLPLQYQEQPLERAEIIEAHVLSIDEIQRRVGKARRSL
jgi:hypothetical protein